MADDLAPANLVLQALHGIRADLKGVHEEMKGMHDEMKGMHEAQDATNARLDRVEQGVDRLATRTTEGFLETNTKLAGLTQVVAGLADAVEQHDRRLDHLLTTGLGAEVRELKTRVTRLESGRRVTAPRKKR